MNSATNRNEVPCVTACEYTTTCECECLTRLAENLCAPFPPFPSSIPPPFSPQAVGSQLVFLRCDSLTVSVVTQPGNRQHPVLLPMRFSVAMHQIGDKRFADLHVDTMKIAVNQVCCIMDAEVQNDVTDSRRRLHTCKHAHEHTFCSLVFTASLPFRTT